MTSIFAQRPSGSSEFAQIMNPNRGLSARVHGFLVKEAANTDAESRTARLKEVAFVPTGHTYPRWLNAVAVIVLVLFPAGLLLAIAGEAIVSLALLGSAFLGLWIFGDIAARYKARKGHA